MQVRGHQGEGIGAGLRGAAEPGTSCGLGSLGARTPLIGVGVGRRGWSRGRSWALEKKEIHSGLQFRRAGTAGTFGNGALNRQLPPEPHTSCLTVAAPAGTHGLTSQWRRKGRQTEVNAATPRTQSGSSSCMSPSQGRCRGPAILPLHAAPPCPPGPGVARTAGRGDGSRSSQAEFPGWPSRAPPLRALRGWPPAPRGPALQPLQTRPSRF